VATDLASITPDTATEFLRRAPLVEAEPRRAAPGSAETLAEAARILDDVRSAMACNPDRARAAAVQLVGVLTRSVGTCGGLAPWQKRRVDRYLSEHLSRPLYAKEIASQVSLSVGHFCRAFKESYGTSPHTHIIRLRLKLAQRLMLTTEYSLSQIALACGMADQSHLSKLFRRGVGETPGAWRRRHLREIDPEARGLRKAS
jgi:AraC family transcriptional regulator